MPQSGPYDLKGFPSMGQAWELLAVCQSRTKNNYVHFFHKSGHRLVSCSISR